MLAIKSPYKTLTNKFYEYVKFNVPKSLNSTGAYIWSKQLAAKFAVSESEVLHFLETAHK